MKKNKFKQICYFSFLKDGLDVNTVINDIKKVSEIKNPKYGLTGQLIYSQEVFIQLLEGDPLNVDITYKIIENDKRHSNLYLIFEQNSEERCFPDWSMEFVSVKSINMVKVNKLLEIANEARETDYFSKLEIQELFKKFIHASES